MLMCDPCHDYFRGDLYSETNHNVMDASISTRKSRKGQLLHGKKEDEREDRISCLPDNILHYIFSFLSTKFAVSTSVLSTRWKQVWIGISNLVFHGEPRTDAYDLMDKLIFMNFVDNVLLHHDTTFIDKFWITDDDIYDCEIKIHAESLITLDWKSNFAYKGSLHSLSSLSKASIDFYCEDDINDNRVSKFIQGIDVVKDLTIFTDAIVTLSKKKLTVKLLAFSNLKTVSHCSRGKHIWMPTMEIGLELMVLGHLKQFLNLFCHTWKSVELSSFDENEKELGLVGFRLKNARALLKVTIRSSSTLSANPKKKIVVLKQLLMLPRVSTCVINIS
ncbi:hypothetical protein IFM89_035721 [Coptis chinensis]|uniref:F-box domain-containing protein n=1 Tax=Coptis chinensis TaxID=261450 RepID=A0A835LFG0_9MAGN|nr:hypothetical protein IFM89_035721 [Coptis chinensis]